MTPSSLAFYLLPPRHWDYKPVISHKAPGCIDEPYLLYPAIDLKYLPIQSSVTSFVHIYEESGTPQSMAKYCSYLIVTESYVEMRPFRYKCIIPRMTNARLELYSGLNKALGNNGWIFAPYFSYSSITL